METLFVFPEKKKELTAIKAVLKAMNIRFEVKAESPYDADFVAKIQESRKEIAEGEGVKIDIKNLWN